MIRRYFLIPIIEIVKAMRKLRDGVWETQIDQTKGLATEFVIVKDTFNQMISEIHSLKMNVYEEQLKHERAKIKQLQLQINPHFFINTLNIIFNLATTKKFELIQEMAQCLVSYFRYMINSHSNFIPLEDELDHTSNYLRIQQLRFSSMLEYKIESREMAKDIEVPPLIVQTMVENSIKYAMSMDRLTTIDVEVLRLDDENMEIYIRDNGPGFPIEVINECHDDHLIDRKHGGGIGISNVKERLKLLYKDRASIELYNPPEAGAVVKIQLPIHR